MVSKGDLSQTLFIMDTPASSNDLKRRSFLRAAFSGALVTPGVMSAEEVEKAIAGQFHEPAKDLPLVEDADVIVCGAGPAGIAAAITARSATLHAAGGQRDGARREGDRRAEARGTVCSGSGARRDTPA